MLRCVVILGRSFAGLQSHVFLYGQIHKTRGHSWLNKFRVWWRNVLDIVKVAALFLFVVGAALRYAPHSSKDVYPSTYRWARKVLSVDICLFFMRGMEFYFVNKYLGPKLTMIYNMVGIACALFATMNCEFI